MASATCRWRCSICSNKGVIAGVLLYGGGSTALGALQAGAVATGLPFTVVLLVMCFSLYVGLHKEQRQLAKALRPTSL